MAIDARMYADRPTPKIPWILTLIHIALATGIAVVGYSYYRQQLNESLQNKAEELNAIAALKAQRVIDWREIRAAEVDSRSQNPLFLKEVQAFLKNPADPERKKVLLHWLSPVIKEVTDVKSIMLLNAEGRVQLSLGDPAEELGDRSRGLAKSAVATNRFIFTDLANDEARQDIYMDLLSPLLIPGVKEALGVLVFRIDPLKTLFPFIQSWPTPSRTSETMLVRPEGNDVVILNELRHRPNKALAVRMPGSQLGLPLVAAAQGRDEIIEGRDYRDVAVLAAVRQIPDSPWTLVVKVDSEEVYAPLRERGRLITILAAAMILVTALTVGFLWQRQRVAFYRSQRDAEVERQALVQHFDYLTKYAYDIILLFDEDLNIVEANDRALSVYGYSRDEMLRKSISNLRAPETLTDVDQTLSLLAEKGALVFETRHRRKDGSLFPVEVSSRVLEIAGRKFYQSIVRDITERKRLEAQLRQATKMEAIGRLAAGVAHDFNNVLTCINGYSDILLTRLAEDDASRPQIEEIRKAGERAASLTRQLLAFSRRQVLQLKVLDLNTMVSNMGNLIRRLIGEDIRLRILREPGLGSVKADLGQIEQVIMNLAANARDAMPNGGDLIIETANVDLDDAFARTHPGARAGAHIMLAIKDTGDGLSPEIRPHLFEPFVTTKELGKGTGLGLSTVYSIVKQSEGYIAVESDEGLGTTFRIYLPRVEETAEIAEEAAAIKAEAQGFETILLVEDEEPVRAVSRKVLEIRGYKVLEASSGPAAIHLCREYDGPIHLVITDVIMPAMNGIELAQQIESLRPSTKVLFLSGYAETRVAERGVLESNVPLLRKPYDSRAFAQKVREVLDSPAPARECSKEC